MAVVAKTCKIDDCDYEYCSKGFCSKHYSAYHKKQIDINGKVIDPAYKERPKYFKCKYPKCNSIKIQGHGLCNKHYRRAKIGKFDIVTCAVIDRKWFKIRNYKIDTINGVRVAVPMDHCKMQKCENTDLKGYGLCRKHYSSYSNGYTNTDGERLVKGLIRYNKDFMCIIPNCGKLYKRGEMVKGMCLHHYSRQNRGFINCYGKVVKENKRVASYKGVRCKYQSCIKQARSSNFCHTHYYHLKKGYVNEKGNKLKNAQCSNVGKICKADGCTKPAHAKLYCNKHYIQMKHYGSLGNWFKNKGHPCSENKCDKPATALAMCSMHYSRYKKYGQTEIPKDKYINKYKFCKEAHCTNNAYCKGYCNKHYYTYTVEAKRNIFA